MKVVQFMAVACVIGIGLATTSALAERRAEDQESPPYPVVLRVSLAALADRTNRQVDRQYDVNQLVLGAHVVGNGRSTGEVTGKAVTDQSGTSFVVSFSGRASSHTTSYRGPAIIKSNTHADFLCSRIMSLEPHQGFVAASATISAQTRLTHEGFESTRPGPLGRVVRRMASRRAATMHGEAQQIAAQDNEREIRREFEKALDEQLAKVNKRLNVATFVNRLFGESAELHIATCSDADCIYFGIGTKETLGGQEKFAVPAPAHRSAERVELWVHPLLFGDEASELIQAAERAPSIASSKPAVPYILNTFSISQDDGQPIGVIAEEGWIVIAIE